MPVYIDDQQHEIRIKNNRAEIAFAKPNDTEWLIAPGGSGAQNRQGCVRRWYAISGDDFDLGGRNGTNVDCLNNCFEFNWSGLADPKTTRSCRMEDDYVTLKVTEIAYNRVAFQYEFNYGAKFGGGHSHLAGAVLTQYWVFTEEQIYMTVEFTRTATGTFTYFKHFFQFSRGTLSQSTPYQMICDSVTSPGGAGETGQGNWAPLLNQNTTTCPQDTVNDPPVNYRSVNFDQFFYLRNKSRPNFYWGFAQHRINWATRSVIPVGADGSATEVSKQMFLDRVRAGHCVIAGGTNDNYLLVEMSRGILKAWQTTPYPANGTHFYYSLMLYFERHDDTIVNMRTRSKDWMFADTLYNTGDRSTNLIGTPVTRKFPLVTGPVVADCFDPRRGAYVFDVGGVPKWKARFSLERVVDGAPVIQNFYSPTIILTNWKKSGSPFRKAPILRKNGSLFGSESGAAFDGVSYDGEFFSAATTYPMRAYSKTTPSEIEYANTLTLSEAYIQLGRNPVTDNTLDLSVNGLRVTTGLFETPWQIAERVYSNFETPWEIEEDDGPSGLFVDTFSTAGALDPVKWPLVYNMVALNSGAFRDPATAERSKVSYARSAILPTPDLTISALFQSYPPSVYARHGIGCRVTINAAVQTLKSGLFFERRGNGLFLFLSQFNTTTLETETIAWASDPSYFTTHSVAGDYELRMSVIGSSTTGGVFARCYVYDSVNGEVEFQPGILSGAIVTNGDLDGVNTLALVMAPLPAGAPADQEDFDFCKLIVANQLVMGGAPVLSVVRGPVASTVSVTLTASPFSSPIAGEQLRSSRWRIERLRGDFSSPVYEEVIIGNSLQFSTPIYGGLKALRPFKADVMQEGNQGSVSPVSEPFGFDSGSVGTDAEDSPDGQLPFLPRPAYEIEGSIEYPRSRAHKMRAGNEVRVCRQFSGRRRYTLKYTPIDGQGLTDDASVKSASDVLYRFYKNRGGRRYSFWFVSAIENELVKVRFVEDANTREEFDYYLFEHGFTLLEVKR